MNRTIRIDLLPLSTTQRRDVAATLLGWCRSAHAGVSWRSTDLLVEVNEALAAHRNIAAELRSLRPVLHVQGA